MSIITNFLLSVKSAGVLNDAITVGSSVSSSASSDIANGFVNFTGGDESLSSARGSSLVASSPLTQLEKN